MYTLITTKFLLLLVSIIIIVVVVVFAVAIEVCNIAMVAPRMLLMVGGFY